MGRKAAPPSRPAVRETGRRPGQMRRPARTVDRQRQAYGPRSCGRDLVGRSLLTADLRAITLVDDFPEVAPVLDRELNVIETYLDVCLNEAFADGDDRKTKADLGGG